LNAHCNARAIDSLKCKVGVCTGEGEVVLEALCDKLMFSRHSEINHWVYHFHNKRKMSSLLLLILL